MDLTDASHGWRGLPRPLAFVFSGGSCLGALQVGMLRAVREAGIEPDLLVGTSVGAINAAFIGGGFTLERVAALEAIWRSIRTADVFSGVGWLSAARALLGSGTLASPTGLAAIVERHLPATHAELAIPVSLVATDLATGAPVVLSDGDLRRHVLASAAIPGVYPPVADGDRTLVDGGVVAHVPLLPAAGLGARTLVVFDAGFP
jgi:NTE family protein